MKEIIRKQINQIGLHDLVLYEDNGIYYSKGIDGCLKKIQDQIQLNILIKK